MLTNVLNEVGPHEAARVTQEPRKVVLLNGS